ncbi:MAG: hypothetical protein DRP80_06975 [Candidatus Omnitrophota bacterium]|nr:MAG: hypothetical protein DRP80_06975 [Candidatus Omnitrophota bacterium]
MEKEVLKIFNPYKKVIYEGGIYHVIQRAPGKDVLFLEDKDYLYFLHLLKETKIKFSLDIFCFCLMLNHLHLLLKINKANLSEAMKSLFTRYALYFNSKYQRKGHVFYGNYRASLCLDENYLISASVYIHLNPSKAGLVKSPLDYRWSSLKAYLQLPRNTFLDYKYILSILGQELKRASLVYSQILGVSEDLEFKNILEDRKFLEKLTFKFISKIKKILNKKPNIEDEISKYFELIENKRRLKKPQYLQARKYLIEQLRSRGYTIKEIAEMLNISRQSIYTTLNS